MTKKIVRWLLIFVLPVLLIGAWSINKVVAQAERICLCHVEDKKSGDGHVIEVDNDSTKEGHLKHGDQICTTCDNVGEPCNTGTGGECTTE